MSRYLWPYLLLIGVLALVFAAMAWRGFGLGFAGDMLGFEYHYDRLGFWEGSRWVLEGWKRHLLATVYSASIHQLFPGQSAAWYALSYLTHFLVGVVSFLLADTVLRRQWRWLAFSAALIFIFHVHQIQGHFELPTGGVRKLSLALALLSLWCHVLYVRGERRNSRWHEFSIATYVLSLFLYEQTALFFVIHPLIAYFEERRVRLWQWVMDSFWFPLIVAVYLFLLRVIFPTEGAGGDTSLSAILERMRVSLWLEFDPALNAERIAPAFQWTVFLLTGIVFAVVFLGLLVWRRRTVITGTTIPEHRTNVVYLIALGLGIFGANLLSVIPTPFLDSRLLYPAAVGIAYVIVGGLALLMNVPLGKVVYAALVAFLIATGLTRTFQIQQDYIDANVPRQRVIDAIQAAVPSLRGDVPPYFLLVSDVRLSDDLHLRVQDTNFPYMFGLLYPVDNIAADGVVYDLPQSLAPALDEAGSAYQGPFIVVEPEGIYSPLRDEVIDPLRVVILFYDSETDTVAVLDELPESPQDNIINRTSRPLRTNFELIGD